MNKPERILHIGDLHFKLFQDHEQVRELITLLEKSIIDNKIDLCYIGGDVVHDYNKYSPEQLTLLNDFFITISNLVPIVMIIGNHDWNDNIERLDALTPIVDNLKTKYPIHFLKDSGSYNLYGIDWWVWSDLDNKEFEKIKHNDLTIGCYHGVVSGSKLHNGQSLDKGLSLETFEQCDNVFLADIHLRQFFRNEDIAFCGSLYQVDWGETDDFRKGGLIWELKDNKYISKELNLESNFFLYTIEFNNCYTFMLNEVELKRLSDKYSKLKIRLIYQGTKLNYNKEIYRNLVKELKNYTPSNINQKKVFLKETIDLKKIKTKNFFQEYFKKIEIEDEVIELLMELDKEYSNNVKDKIVIPQIIDLDYHEISNFGPFGVKQIINFEILDGIVGISAKNKTGKSFLLDSLLFNLTNFTLRNVPKKKFLINKNHKESAKLSTILRTNNKKYRIDKVISHEDDSKVNYFEIEDDNIINKNEKKQTDTLKRINEDIIDYDNLVLSNFYSQMYGKRFLDLNQGGRFDYFTKILNLSHHEDKYDLSNADLKKYNQQVEFKKEQIKEETRDLLSLKEELSKLVITTVDEEKTKLKQSLINKIDDLRQKYYSIKLEYENFDYNNSKNKIDSNNLQIANIKKTIETLSEERNAIDILLKNKYKDYEDIIHLEVDKKLYKQYNDLETELENLNNTKCVTCNRTFDNIDEEANKKKSKSVYNKMLKLQDKTDKQEEDIRKDKNNYKKLNDLAKSISEKQNLLSKYEKENILLEDSIKRYNKEKNSLEKKQKLNEEINKLSAEQKLINKEISEIELTQREIEKKSLLVLDKETRIEKLKNEIIDIETKVTYLELYVKGMNKKGIRSLIINDKIDTLNNFLEELLLDFDFNLEVKISDKNEIEVFFYDESGEEQYASLCSGMESFLIDLSLKNAFNQISELNKINLFIIDEGFGTLDSLNLELIINFLNRLKKYNDKILIVSHIDSLKCCFDFNLELEKEGLDTVIKNTI
jgi:DNA repair exonuclease SbcCD ATPase subunit/DNA repair exonuclease SbcCD nuclease subunit